MRFLRPSPEHRSADVYTVESHTAPPIWPEEMIMAVRALEARLAELAELAGEPSPSFDSEGQAF